MKKIYLLCFALYVFSAANAQTTFQRVYTTLNTKCQNASCHSATSSDGLKFDGSETAVYNAIFNVNPSNASSLAKFEKIVKPQHPYMSFLLRKAAGAQFDADLAIDSTEGNPMLDINGQPLTKIEIEWIRQWIRYGAKQTYSGTDVQPDYATIVQYYTDTNSLPFLPKPQKPAPGTGFQFRMGPVFLPTTGAIEQEWLQQQEVNFPFEAEIYEIDGFMNQQSHHFLLFKYDDTSQAASGPDKSNLCRITPVNTFNTSFDGNKSLTGAWQADDILVLPQGTAMMWDQKTILDMNYHVKNYNATTVLPCDFYFNIYFKPRDAQTVPMISHLVNNPSIGRSNIGCSISNPVFPPTINYIPSNTDYSQDYADGDNNGAAETRYLWMTAGHTHQRGTSFYLIRKDANGQLADTIYDGQYDYKNGFYIGAWDHSHPPIEYWNNGLFPVQFGGPHNSGIVSRAHWYTTETCIPFAFTTQGEMELFYYMYTTRLPDNASGISAVNGKEVSFQVQPNPMSTSGKLVYVLDKAAKVEASIVDVAGKTVAHLAEENEQQGDHEVDINADYKLSAGIYFARLTVDGSTFTKKFVVTK